jgi:hypothetical protein
MNKLTLALGAVIAIKATLALTTVSLVMTQQALGAGTTSSTGFFKHPFIVRN